jgi:hypothetical protein
LRTYITRRTHPAGVTKKLITSRRISLLFAASAALFVSTAARASTSTQIEQLGPLAVPRTAHTATALSDGRVLIVGGRDSAGTALAAAEIFDPATQTSTAIGSLVVARTGHTATLLQDGRVLIAGGTNATGALTSAEIFDPAALEAGFRLLSANLGTPRTRHTATLLSSGRVLMAGGDDAGTAEVFDPATGSFSPTLLSMANPRSGHTATLFSGDSVLLAGGQTDSMEFFNAANETFTLDSQKLSSVRTGEAAIALGNTRVLFFGGDTNNTIEEFDISTGTLSLKASMDAPASTATLLANDKVLVLRSDSAGLYAPDGADQTSLLEVISVPSATALHRSGQTATEIHDGKKILVAGGVNAQNEFIAPVALFNPARIWTDKDDYQPDDPVVLSGSGWKANENIYLFAVDSETDQWTYESTIGADANGEFTVSPYFIVQLRHLNVTFDATAMGAMSTMVAKVSFTDAGNFTYVSNPSPATFSNPPGNIASFTESVTAPKNNGTFSATLVLNGTGGTPMPSSWMSLNTGAQQFVTGGSGGNPDTKSWTVTITVAPATPDGTYTGKVTASVTSGTGPNTGAGTDVTITIDNTPPAAPSAPVLASGSNSGSNADTITNVNTPNFVGTAEPNSTIKIFDGATQVASGTTASNGNYNVGPTSILSDGTHSNITAKATDAAGNQSGSSAPSSVTIDTSRPSVTINQAGGQSDPTSTSPINFTVIFSESVADFATGDVSLSGTAGATTATVTGSGTTYNVAVTGMTTSGTVIATIGQNRASDTAANNNTASTSTDNTVQFNNCTAPSVTLNPISQTVTYGAASVSFSATASGTPAPTVQWQVSTNGGAFSDIGGATNTTLTINNPTVAMSGNQYHAVFTNSCNPATATSTAATLTVSAATPTITWSNPADITYGTALSATQLNATASVPGNFTYTPAAGTVLSAGTNQNLHVDFVPNDTTNYNNASKDVKINVGKAHLTVTADDQSKSYDGDPFTGFTAKLSGFVNGENSSAVSGSAGFTGNAVTAVNHGTYTITPTVGSLSATNYDFPPANFVNGTLTIGKADATVVVTPYTSPTTTYDGNSHTATVTSITGVNGETGATVGTVDVSNTTHTNAGTYASDYWFFTGTANYNNIGNTTITDSIGKANATVVVTPYTSPTTTYDGNSHTATVTSITGVNGETGATVGTVDVSNTTHTNAGTYASDYWFFTGTANYNNIGNTAITDSIGKADATVVVAPYDVPYDGHSHTATVTSITGVNGEMDATVGTVDVSNTTHTNAATYSSDTWSFTGTANYNDIAATTITDKIRKADATVVVTPYDVTYNGQSHTATVTSITGVNGETGATVGTVNVSNTAHTNAGTYSSDTWSFTGGINYNDIAATTITDKIKKADAIVLVSGYSGTYDAMAHGATGSVTGVDAGGAALGSSLDLGATFINVPGGLAHWVFTGGTNYNDQSGDVAIIISQAPSFTTVTVTNKTYNGLPQGGTANVIGVGGLNQSVPVKYIGRNLTVYGPSNTAPTDAGDYTAQARYPGDLNHLDSRDSKDYTISKAALTITAGIGSGVNFTNVFTKQYSDPITFTVKYVGFVNGETESVLGGTLVFSPTAATAQFLAPGTYTITPSGLTSNNYVITFQTGTLTETQEDARATYAGALFVSTSSATSSTATVTLSATIQDITAVDPSASPPNPDNYPGDIRNAKVTFINRDTNTVIASNLPVGLVNAADLKTGTATYNWSVNIGTQDALEYTIGVIVNNYYTRDSSGDNVVVEVSKPIPGSITGGGYLVLQSSAGVKAGGAGTKNNFGFNVKNSSKGVKGTINTIVRNGAQVYQIKGNAMTSLATKLPPAVTYSTATFNGKANIQDITNPLAPISVDGNATLQVQMTDKGEPGSSDTIAVTVWNKSGGLWFSSNWSGTQTTEKLLGGGNLQVR